LTQPQGGAIVSQTIAAMLVALLPEAGIELGSPREEEQ
jgi:hypothetical protein